MPARYSAGLPPAARKGPSAGDIMKLPKAEQNLGEWQAAIECLILVAEKNRQLLELRIRPQGPLGVFSELAVDLARGEVRTIQKHLEANAERRRFLVRQSLHR